MIWGLRVRRANLLRSHLESIRELGFSHVEWEWSWDGSGRTPLPERDRRLEAVGNRRTPGRHRGLPGRDHRDSRRRPHPLDAQRQGARGREQRRRRSARHPERAGDVRAGGRRQAHAHPGRSAAAPSRSRLGLDRARFPGAHGRQRDRRDGGEPPPTDHGQGVRRRDFRAPATGRSLSPTMRPRSRSGSKR